MYTTDVSSNYRTGTKDMLRLLVPIKERTTLVVRPFELPAARHVDYCLACAKAANATDARGLQGWYGVVIWMVSKKP